MDDFNKGLIVLLVGIFCGLAGMISIIGYFNNACIALVKDKPAIEIKLICK